MTSLSQSTKSGNHKTIALPAVSAGSLGHTVTEDGSYVKRKLSARHVGGRSTKTDQPDSKSYDKPTVGVYRRILEKPDISISPESGEREKREAWEQINLRCHPMAEFMILVRKGFPKTNGTTVNVWFGGKK